MNQLDLHRILERISIATDVSPVEFKAIPQRGLIISTTWNDGNNMFLQEIPIVELKTNPAALEYRLIKLLYHIKQSQVQGA